MQNDKGCDGLTPIAGYITAFQALIQIDDYGLA